ncbi:MAG: GspE/PulE family protein [Cyanobacteria bacterium P01_H01_bin.74]
MDTIKPVKKNDPPESLKPVATNYKRIGDILIAEGFITKDDLVSALTTAKNTGQKLGHTLIAQKKITMDQLGLALGKQTGFKYVSLSKLNIDNQVLDLLPEQFIKEKQILPIGKERGRLVVAMVDPSNRELVDEVTFITGMRPLVTITTSIEYIEFCNILYGNKDPSGNLKEEVSSFMEQLSITRAEEIKTTQLTDTDVQDENNPLVRLVNSILEKAIEQNASDIHIEPRPQKYLVRFRIDGILRSILDVPQNMESSFITRIKVMAKMDIAEHRRPQDGRINLNQKNINYNLRVNSLPVSDGREKLVVRILRPSKSISDFKRLGIDTEDIDKIEQLYQAPHGILLVCGPTGSGKTTTLYTILQKINDDIRNISTVEDPVELQIEGLNQSQVNTKADYTFASSMRALLRQDPDVIMVGEIRDYETLEAAFHASLTGHLVLSTIHSNTTAATITRMIEMGAASNLIGTALIGIIAQRLVRNLCNYCKAEFSAREADKKFLFPFSQEARNKDIKLYSPQGCERCMNTGYSGRSGLYEIMVVDREIRQMINESQSDVDIEDSAIASGMKSLMMHGRQKILDGVTSIAEVVRVLGTGLGH